MYRSPGHLDQRRIAVPNIDECNLELSHPVPFLAGLAAALVSVLAYVMAQIASALTVRN
jgi:hypothetical protein